MFGLRGESLRSLTAPYGAERLSEFFAVQSVGNIFVRILPPLDDIR